MPRSTRDSDDDVEMKTGRKTRLSSIHSIMDSPVRRSTRIKQPAKQIKSSSSSPLSEVDSISSNQSTKIIKRRTGSVDATSLETKGRGRRISVSSDITEASESDIQIGTPRKSTRRSLATIAIDTPTKANIRATSKRLTRAGSETKSPLPTARMTRSRRATSVDVEISDQNKSHPGTPIKIRKQASVLPSSSPVQEVEEKNDIPIIEIDNVLTEVNESGNSENLDVSSNQMSNSQQKHEKSKDINKNEDEKDSSNGDIPQLDNESEMHMEEEKINKKEERLVKDRSRNSSGVLLSDVNGTIDEIPVTMNMKCLEVNILKLSETEASPKIKQSAHQMYEKSPIKELRDKTGNISTNSVEDRKSLSNKENQALNIINDVNSEKNISSIVFSNMTSLNSLTSALANKSLNEKENKSSINEKSLTEYSHLTESTACSALSKEITDDVEENINISIISSKIDIKNKNQDDINGLSISNPEKQRLVHEFDVTVNDINTSVSSQNESMKLINDSSIKSNTLIENVNECNNKSIETINESNKINKRRYSKQDNATSDEFIVQKEHDCDEESSNLSNVNDNITSPSKVRNRHTDSELSLELAIDSEHTSPFNESRSIESAVSDKQLFLDQDNVTDNLFNSSKSNNLNEHEATLKSNQSFEESPMNISATEAKQKHISEHVEDTKTLKCKNMNNSSSATEANSSEFVKCEKNQEDECFSNYSDFNVQNLFKNISADEWKSQNFSKDADLDNNSVHSMITEKLENESEAECDDLVLVDKKAWLAAESIKATKDQECFDYDSDDTVLLKLRLDTSQGNNDTNKLDTIREELLMDIDSEEDGEIQPVKSQKSPSKRKSTSKKDSSIIPEEDANKLNLQQATNETERSFKIPDESEGCIDGLNKSSSEDKENTSSRKSTENTKLNRSLKDKTSKRSSLNLSNVSANKLEINNSFESNDVVPKTKSKIENDVSNTDNDVTESKNRNSSSKKSRKSANVNLNRSTDKQSKSPKAEISKQSNADNIDKIDDNEIIVPNKDSFKNRKSNEKDTNFSIIAHVGSDNDEISSNDNSCHDDSSKICTDYKIPRFLFITSSSDDDNNDNDSGSVFSDIDREYNLTGKERKFSDDDVPGDECRGSETESSDPDDNGSDLADFVVDDDEIEDDEEEDTDNVEDSDKPIEQVTDDENESENEDIEVKEKNAGRKETTENETDDSSNHTDKMLHNSKNESNISIEYVSSNETNKKVQAKMQKAPLKTHEGTILLDSPNLNSSNEKKKKSGLQNSFKDKLDDSVIKPIKKLLKLDTPMKCSTPKLKHHNPKIDINVNTPITSLEIESNKLNKNKSKDSVLKEDVSLKECSRTNNKKLTLLQTNPPDLSQSLKEIDLLKTISSGMTELHKTLSFTHTETPTIRHLRKEKLNESAPTLNLKLSTDSSQSEKKLCDKEGNDLVETKDGNMEVDSDDTLKKSDKRKQRKRKEQEETLLKKNNKRLCQETAESNVSKKKKHTNSTKLSIEEDNYEASCQSDEKKNKNKKKKVAIIQEEEDITEINMLPKNNSETENVSEQHNKRKKKKIRNDLESTKKDKIVTVVKETDLQEKMKNKNDSAKKLSKQKKKKGDKALSLEVQSSELKAKSTKVSKKSQLQNIVLDTIESKHATFIKAREEALEAIKHATENIKADKELKKKRKRDDTENLQKHDIKISAKHQKNEIVEEKIKNVSSTTGLKRLPDDVIENLSDLPKKTKKRRKMSQNEEQIVPSRTMNGSDFAESKAKNDSFIPLSSCGSTTQFAVINMQKAKKRPPKKSAAVVNFRQRMLARNNREPISTYMMYLQKQRATGNNPFPNNLF